jgi:hypothetical protein
LYMVSACILVAWKGLNPSSNLIHTYKLSWYENCLGTMSYYLIPATTTVYFVALWIFAMHVTTVLCDCYICMQPGMGELPAPI